MSYIYDFAALFAVAAIAKRDATVEGGRSQNVTGYILVLSAASIVGALLCLLRPEIYGLLPFKFTREGRGEVVLWVASGCHVILVCFLCCLLMNAKHQGKYQTISATAMLSVMIAIGISTMTRTVIYQCLFPLILAGWCYVFARPGPVSWTRIAIALFASLLTLLIVAVAFGVTLLLGDSGDMLQNLFNGREQLWLYYMKIAAKAPILGNGMMPLDRAIDYDGTAYTEVGLLRILADKGLLVGLPMFVFISFAAYVASKTLVQQKAAMYEKATSLIVLVEFPNFILQEHARWLGLYNYVFYYCVIFTFYRGLYRSGLPVSIDDRRRSMAVAPTSSRV